MINHPNLTRKRREAAVVASGSNLPGRQFAHLRNAVAARFAAMGACELFRTDVDKDALWDCYLSSFPEGSNPVFRKRTEHDCSCCRQFVRAVGNVVAIVDGELVSLWDVVMDDAAHQTVADAMSSLVKSRPIANAFLHVERTAGTDRTFEQVVDGARTWEHFFVNIPNDARRGGRNFVCSGVDIGPRLSESRALHDVLLRSLGEISVDAVDAVLELIAQNSLYRGEEHTHAVSTFRSLKAEFDRLSAAETDFFVWARIGSLPASVSKIRNTSIGTLLVDLSEGRDMEAAVKAFEAMVAPANYKRPTAPVTKAMVERAKATVEELGLTSALDRRYATLVDVTADNILFADRSARKALAGDVFDDIAGGAAVKARTFDKVQEIGVEKFLSDVLPSAASLEILVENRHAGNLVSLVAPGDPTAKPMFKWGNRFSWSYNGDFADSVKERVKRAGGNVTGELCCRLGWFNRDDLDFHMQEPPGGGHIFYGDKRSRSGGCLDVDMNVRGETREPVENIYYGTTRSMPEGVYVLFVHQFTKRDTADVGFEAEIDFRGETHRFAYAAGLRQDATVTVAEFKYTRAAGMEIISSLPFTSVSRKVWELDTGSFHRVSAAMLSPNHWDGHGVGNRHYFFMLDGCRNDGTARGFYNEFLKGELDPHRKVLELVGSRMRTEESVDQLSGLGFSSTQRNHAVVRVAGAFTRTLRVVF